MAARKIVSPRYSLVADKDVKKPTKLANKLKILNHFTSTVLSNFIMLVLPFYAAVIGLFVPSGSMLQRVYKS